MVDTAATKYWIGFSRTKGVGYARLRLLIEQCGSVESAWKASPAEWRAAGLDSRTLTSLAQTRAKTDLDAELRAVGKAGARIVTIDDATYPPLLREISDPPFLLYVKGDIALDGPAVAMVGTRTATSYGLAMARELAGALAERGFTIISGLARGIDAAAHRAALEVGGLTIGVMATGIDTIYPPENRELGETIATDGALIAELPLGSNADRLHFVPRNRIISGMALATVIVEASEKSGALSTAGQALDQGREVFAVPGNARSLQSKGTNGLIQNGATMVTSADDLLSVLQVETEKLRPRPPAPRKTVKEPAPKASAPPAAGNQAAPRAEATPTEASLLRFLSAEPQGVDDLAYRSGLPVATITATLTMLQVSGRVEEVGIRQYIRLW